MNLPTYTAEASLYGSSARYRMDQVVAASRTEGGAVVPQMLARAPGDIVIECRCPCCICVGNICFCC
jgi:hypothetical protein